MSLCKLGNFSCFHFCPLSFFSKNSSKNTIRVSNSIGLDHARCCVQTVCKCYQQTIKIAASKAKKELNDVFINS